MQIVVKDMQNRNVSLTVDGSDTIENLKDMIEESEGVPAQMQRLIFSGKQLQDGQTIADYNIKNGSFIHLVLRLLGGF
ncbi:hypothetical protein Bca4012_083597 [Brassica carinata]